MLELNTISVGDCMDLFALIPDRSVDLVVCDLPYGKVRAVWDTPIDLGELWEQYARVCTDTCVVVLFATQPFATQLIRSNTADFRYDLIWVKNKTTGHLNAKKMPMRKHEHVLVFYKKPGSFSPQKTTGHAPVSAFYTRKSGTTFGHSVSSTGGGSRERYPTSILDFAVVNNDDPCRIHSAQKPVDLLQYLIRSYSKAGDTVLDNCAGSCSLAIAAIRESRNFICFEKDPALAAKAKKLVASELRRET